MANKLRYSDFMDRIDLDAFYDAIGWQPTSTKGDEDMGHCLDIWGMHKHGDRTGKFSINRAKKVYGCWVCGGGTLLSLAMEFNNELDPDTATRWLYQFTRSDQTEEEFLEEMEALLADPDDRKPVMPYYNERVLDRMTTPITEAEEWDGKRWVPFLERRKIDPATAEEFKLRYDSGAVRFAPTKTGDDNYVGPAITFPHYWRGRLVGWQQRWLEPEDIRPKWVPKYTNTPDFPKSETIFNYDLAVRNIHEPIIVVESVPTVIFLASHGWNAVATFGAPKETQLKILRSLTQGIVIAPDNDDPGIKGRKAMTDYLERYIPVYWLPPVDGPPGADLGDLPVDQLDRFIAQAGDPLEYELSGV